MGKPTLTYDITLMRRLAIFILLIWLYLPSFTQNLSVFFYGTSVEVPIAKSLRFSLKGVNAQEFDRAWRHLSKSNVKPIVLTCQKLKADMNLNGWAVYMLVSKIGEQLQIQGRLGKNEAAIFETFLLTRLGYDARVACLGNQYLFVTCPVEERFASVKYMAYRGKRYYLLGMETPMDIGGYIFSIPEKDTIGLAAIDLHGSSLINFEGESIPSRLFKSSVDSSMKVSVAVNKGMMEFYAEMPQVIDPSFYARQPLSEQVEKQILPDMKKALQNKSEEEAVNMILHFMHTAFEYKTDIENYGYERTYFKEEMFFHPYNDCEDRSILFTYLVEKLLGLDTIMLEYPGHVSAGVRFNEDVKGDYIILDGIEYMLCDPSFVKSCVGNANPKYKNMTANIYRSQSKVNHLH